MSPCVRGFSPTGRHCRCRSFNSFAKLSHPAHTCSRVLPHAQICFPANREKSFLQPTRSLRFTSRRVILPTWSEISRFGAMYFLVCRNILRGDIGFDVWSSRHTTAATFQHFPSTHWGFQLTHRPIAVLGDEMCSRLFNDWLNY